MLVLNDKCLIPGTRNYNRRQLMREQELNVEVARTAAIEARYRSRENESYDSQIKQLTAS